MITPTLRTSLATRIQLARTNAKLQQQELADAVGLTRTSISNIERGKQGLSVDMLYCIAQQLHVPADILLRDAIDGAKNNLDQDLLEKLQAGAPDTAVESIYNLIKGGKNEQ